MNTIYFSQLRQNTIETRYSYFSWSATPHMAMFIDRIVPMNSEFIKLHY